METVQPEPRRRRPMLVWGTVGVWTLLVSGLVVIGADLLWVVSVGDVVRLTGQVPDTVPNLVAPQVDWHNPVVLAQVLLSWVNSWGWAALPALDVLITALTLIAVVADGRRAGGSDVRLAVAVSLVALGAASAFVVVRFPMLSLLPFVLLVGLLREWGRGRQRALWWVPLLMVLWGNLHGAVLVGLAVLGVFVVLAGRRGVLQRVTVGVLSLLSLVLTSAGTGTPAYYVNALANEAAARGTDLWARPSLTSPLDVVLLIAAGALVAMAWRSLRLWEWVVVAGLVVGTVSAARNGVWLLLFLAPLAGVPWGARSPSPVTSVRPGRRHVVAGLVGSLLLVAGVGVQLARRADAVRPPGTEAVAAVSRVAAGGTVLAVEPEAETFAQQGIRVWMANPIDAFATSDQAAFLDFLHDCRVPDAPVDVVVVDEACTSSVVSQGWSVVLRQPDLVVLGRAR